MRKYRLLMPAPARFFGPGGVLVWAEERTRPMKGKRYSTEDKIRILREADRGQKSIQAICQEQNISEVSFHRWKRPFGQVEVKEARRCYVKSKQNSR
jgi:putative transposase